jgi:hypothetical protein
MLVALEMLLMLVELMKRGICLIKPDINTANLAMLL